MNVRRSSVAVSQIARTEMKRYLQDRIAIFSTVLMPIVLIVLIGSVIGSYEGSYVVGVLDDDDTSTSEHIIASLDYSDALQVEVYDNARELRRDLRLGLLSAGVLLPDGLGDQVAAGETAALDVVTLPSGGPVGAVVAAVNGAIAEEGGQLGAAGFVARQADVSASQALREVAFTAQQLPPAQLDETSIGVVRQEDENAFTGAVTSQLTLFVFMNGLIAGAVLVSTRQLGVARRALTAPIGPGTLVTGLGGSRFGLALVQAGLLLVVGAVLFGVVWGDLWAVGLLTVVYCLVATGAGMLLGSLARTTDQAIAIAIPVAIGTSMLGGTMWPLDVVGPVMQRVGHLMPQAWAMDAWSQIVNEGAGVAGIATDLAVLTGFAAAFLVVGSWALRRTLTR